MDQTALAGVEPVGELSMSLILPQGLGGLWKLTKDYSSPPRPFPGTHYLHAIPYEGEVEMEGGRLLAWDSGEGGYGFVVDDPMPWRASGFAAYFSSREAAEEWLAENEPA